MKKSYLNPFRLALGAAALALALPHGAAVAQQKFITIGTGGVTGVYYAVGGAICRLMNKDRAKHGIRCSVESTGGSVFNINTIRGRRARFRRGAVRRAVPRRQGQQGIREGRQVRRSARGLLGPSGAVHGAGAQGSQHHRSSRTSRASASTSAIRARARAPRWTNCSSAMGWTTVELRAGLRAEGRRARRRAVRQQDRRLLLRRRPSVGEHPGSDHDLRRQAGAADRRRRSTSWSRTLRTTPRSTSRAACMPAIRTRRRPTACSRPS